MQAARTHASTHARTHARTHPTPRPGPTPPKKPRLRFFQTLKGAPPPCTCSVAVVHLPHVRALLALNPTTPVELAITVVLLLLYQRVVAATAAHQRAAVEAVAGLIAAPTTSAQRPDLRVVLAKVRRLLQVHEVILSGSLLVLSHALQAPPLVVQADEAGAVEFVFEVRADGAKRFEFAPADLDGAGAGDAVTLADDVQGVLGRLKHSAKELKQRFFPLSLNPQLLYFFITKKTKNRDDCQRSETEKKPQKTTTPKLKHDRYFLLFFVVVIFIVVSLAV